MQTPSDKRYNKKLDRIDRRLEKGMKSRRQAERNLNKAERIEKKAGEFETYNRAAGTADAALDQYANLSDYGDAFNREASRQGKKLNRIEKRSEKGFKSQKQAGRNFDRLEKITKETSGVDELFNRYNRATTLADQVISQYDEFDDSSPANNSAPFYKTGCIDYNKK